MIPPSVSALDQSLGEIENEAEIVRSLIDDLMNEFRDKLHSHEGRAEFYRWAFGESLGNLSGHALIDKWNELHGDIVKFDANQVVLHSLGIMQSAYLAHLFSKASMDFGTDPVYGKE